MDLYSVIRSLKVHSIKKINEECLKSDVSDKHSFSDFLLKFIYND